MSGESGWECCIGNIYEKADCHDDEQWRVEGVVNDRILLSSCHSDQSIQLLVTRPALTDPEKWNLVSKFKFGDDSLEWTSCGSQSKKLVARSPIGDFSIFKVDGTIYYNVQFEAVDLGELLPFATPADAAGWSLRKLKRIHSQLTDFLDKGGVK